jgi:hypothetical protein
VGDHLEVLEDDPEVAPQERDRLGGQARDVAPAEEDVPLVDGVLAVDQLQQRALAGSARAGDEDELATLDHQVDVAQRRDVGAEVLPDALHHQDRAIGIARIAAGTGTEERERADDLAVVSFAIGTGTRPHA